MKDIEFIWETFPPAETATITGVSPQLQRTRRHHGNGPDGIKGKWTRNSLYDVAALLVQEKLSALGVPPHVSKGSADFGDINRNSCAVQILLWAQESPEATADPHGFNLRELPIKGSPNVRKRYFIKCAGSGHFANDLADFFQTSKVDASTAIVIDLKRLGEHIVKTAGRALWTVQEVSN